MSSIVVVALPAEDEPVWDLSSEKKPHLTILYMEAPLGAEFDQIVQFVEHAARTSLTRFGLSVDRRGTLGKDDADVLFFEQMFGSDLRKFRANLLKNDTIKQYYDRAEQFPVWTPHLTMGYPDRPAKEPENRYDLQWINFDRIAIFRDDYEGPAFDLPKGDYALAEAAWSDEFGVSIAHFGVKGMRWGVRKDKIGYSEVNLRSGRNTGGSVSRTSDSSKRETKRDKKSISEVGKFLNDEMFSTKNIGIWNARMRKADDQFSNSDGSLNVDEYRRVGAETFSLLMKHSLRQANLSEVSVSFIPTGPDQYLYAYGDKSTVDEFLKDASPKKVKHSIEPKLGTFVVRFDISDSGEPDGYTKLNESFVHSSDFEDVLEHFGIKGMRWGVRRKVGSDGLVSGSSPKPNLKSKFLTDSDVEALVSDLKSFTSTKALMGYLKPHFKKYGEETYVKVHNTQLSDKGDVENEISVYLKPELADKNLDAWNDLPYNQRVKDLNLTTKNDVGMTEYGEDDPDDAYWFDNFGEAIEHFGIKGMRWGIRRPVGSNGLVKGSVAEVIRNASGGKAVGLISGDPTKGSSDHKKVMKNLTKDVSKLSTSEIKEITQRLEAIKKFKEVTYAQKVAKRSRLTKIALWARDAAFQGAKNQGESWIKEFVGDTLRDVLPKTKTQAKKDEDERKKNEDRDRKIKSEDAKAEEKRIKDEAEAKREWQSATNDLFEAIIDIEGVYNVTTKKGG